MRRVNLRSPSSQYYPVVVPSVAELGRWFMDLHGMCPGVDLVATKRDFASAFRLLRSRPALSLLMATEFPANHIPLPRDLVCIYLAMPFGRNGAPSNFARLGAAIASAHLQCGSSRSTRCLNHAFQSVMYVDGGIFIELKIPLRLTNTTICWEFFSRGILGEQASGEDKMSIDGTWESGQILIGFAFNLKDITISLPEQNMTGAKVFFSDLFGKQGSHFLTLLEVQQPRGHLEHFQTTNEMWGLSRRLRIWSCAIQTRTACTLDVLIPTRG